ncbi:glutaredoxin domain-containing protein [Streptomyces montanisoli]|uniref:Glutaredoxin domain-containing protein n=1 Tax=Streptomyces montanisoli TaxID=2798581 RepID=A0A940MBX1_9ACTN|nr:glutaredoxin domain-containing protein [Streptomyces montanisoli]MBP0457586.1 hypothetical protein [Streptomyces montanisoli]
MRRVWGIPALFVLCGAVFAAGMAFGGTPAAAIAPFVAFVLLAALQSPLAFPRSIGAAEAQRRSASDGRPIVFWRPGCMYCIRLRMRLGRRARQLHWVNIWLDPDAAATVRAANEGNETVPTVLVADRPHTNPDPQWVRDQLSRTA